MRRCIETHVNDKFGEIPAGSVWRDDSPYVDSVRFVDVDAKPEPPEPAPRKVRQLGDVRPVAVMPKGEPA
jgi:hypothetical protein